MHLNYTLFIPLVRYARAYYSLMSTRADALFACSDFLGQLLRL
jgi:hypothetical protein